MSDTIAKLRDLLLNSSKAGRLRGLLDSIYGAASTGAEAYGSASSPMSAEHSGLLGGLLMDMSPLGDAKSAYDGVQSAREGDWLGAGLGALGALPMVPNLAGVIKGGDTVFHAGKTKITEIDPLKLQSRDSGYYGRGFYVGESPDGVKGYGKTISKFDVAPDARILDVGMLPTKNQEKATEIADFFYNQGVDSAKARGKLDNFLFEIEQIKKDPLAYKNAADRFAEQLGYDIVQYAPNEIVIKNLQKIKPK